MYCDTHTHINLISENQSNWLPYINHALSHDVHFILNIGVDKKTISESFQLAQQYDFIFWTAGYHPSDLKEDKDNIDLNFLKAQCIKPKLLGIGEIGLDYYYHQDNKKEQQNLFEEQIAIALEHKLPIIIHTRDAWDDTFSILNNFNQNVSGIFHCFSGDYNIAKKCMDYNFMISFAGNVTFKKAYNLQDTVLKLPVEKIFIETDAPYLTPVPKRGHRNEPAYVEYIYQFVAGLKNIHIDTLTQQIQQNVQTFFNLEEL